jgi:glutathione-specific gamma-glutamylcyclotransferase
MVLNRQALESKLLQQLLAHPQLDFKIWTDEELLQSIRATLQQRPSKELWIFAYGSLIWNPLFDYSDRRSIIVEGWQRNFCLLAPVGRGTIDNPGLVLGLEENPEGCCQGIGYCLPIDENLESELLLLWRREMVVGSYIPTWITARNSNQSLGKPDENEIEVLAFTVNPQHSAYVNNLSTQTVVESLATAQGSLGTSAEYLCNTVQGLLAAGIADQALIELDTLVKCRQQKLLENQKNKSST